MTRSIVRFALALAIVALPGAAAAVDPVYSAGLLDPVAIARADPVAYFTEGRHVPGDAEFEAEWNGATWSFASAAHRDAFLAEPARYAPQYGGYCAYAVAHGNTVRIDPKAWSVVDGKLYLNYSRSIQEKWQAKRALFIVRADEIWPALLAGS